MSTATLPETITNSSQQDDKVCHIFCKCRPKITLCGAYNHKYPQICGDIGASLTLNRCRGCGKKVCKQCKSELKNPCPGCGIA